MDKYQTTFTSWNKIAALYQQIFMDLDLYNDTYDAFLNMLNKPGAKIVEIGCGPGNITKYMLAKRPDLRFLGTDVAPDMIELARKNNPQASFEIMDCRNLGKVSDKYDALICGFCLPYLSHNDTAKMIQETGRLLYDSGLIYLSTIEGNDDKSGYESGSTGDQMYVYYYSEDALLKMLKEGGFRPKQIFRKPYKRSTGEESVHLIIIAEKA